MNCRTLACESGFGLVDIFFFSSRRRHTGYIGDWSSDVCSSDLPTCSEGLKRLQNTSGDEIAKAKRRSEERRIGKECILRWWCVRWRRNYRIIAETRIRRKNTGEMSGTRWVSR